MESVISDSDSFTEKFKKIKWESEISFMCSFKARAWNSKRHQHRRHGHESSWFLLRVPSFPSSSRNQVWSLHPHVWPEISSPFVFLLKSETQWEPIWRALNFQTSKTSQTLHLIRIKPKARMLSQRLSLVLSWNLLESSCLRVNGYFRVKFFSIFKLEPFWPASTLPLRI